MNDLSGLIAQVPAIVVDTATVIAPEVPAATLTATNTTAETTTTPYATYVNFDNPSWDTFLFVFFLIAAFLYGISLGRDRIIVILVSIYMAMAIIATLPAFVLNIQFNENFAFEVTAFISVFIVLFFLLSRSALMNTLGEGKNRGSLIEVIVFSFLHVGLLISIAMGFMPAPFLVKFSALTQTIFLNEWSRFGWIAAPIVAMIILGRKPEED